MSTQLLCVTAALVASGIALQIWSTQPKRIGRHHALQLPVILLYSLAGTLFLFSTFPDSLSEGRALGFTLGGAAGLMSFIMVASFAWLAKTRSRDEMAAELVRATTENERLTVQLAAKESSSGEPKTLRLTTRYDASIRGTERHRIGLITGNLANILGIDVWVNSENSRMEMSRIVEPTISATIRYHGGRRDEFGHLVHDTIALELSKHMAGRSQVAAGHVLMTGPGELRESHQVKRIAHVAAVEGEPGAGFRQVLDLGRCVRNIMAEVDRLNQSGEALHSVVLPLLGTGGGNSDLRETAEILISSVIGYFQAHPGSKIRVVYLLGFTDIQAAVCRAVLESAPDLAQ
ncbi:hypothetical protein AB0957_15125 [Streptomyces zhihengii]|uniref:hypothetical protein n=1 Tax=Streptomyces zhihengii TaxID=1818004 RepID=UPI0034562888